MAPRKQGVFTVRYTPHRCPKCGEMMRVGSMAYRVKSFVYCPKCAGAPDRDDKPDRTRATPKPAKKTAPPDPTKGGGAMPGTNAGQRCSDKVYRSEFASVTEAVHDALEDYAQNDGNAEFLRKTLAECLTGNDRWLNQFTKARFLQELSDPSKHLLEAVDLMRQKLVGEVAPPSTPRRKIRRGQEWGEELDADRWLVRDLTPWERSVREKQPRHTVTIGCNLSVNAGVRPEELLYRGAAALALADILTSRGVNVGIVAFQSRANPTASVDFQVIRYVLKDPLMPLDISAVAFAMCEIAWFRVVGAVGGIRTLPGKVNSGLGFARKLPAAVRESIDFLVDSDVLGEQAAESWLRGCMASQEQEATHV